MCSFFVYQFYLNEPADVRKHIYSYPHTPPTHTHKKGREVPAATSNINTITGIRTIIIKHSGLIIILWLT